MGYHTSPVTAFLLTLFNVRLGWWFPNPGKTTAKSPSPHFNLTYLLAELFGGASDKSTVRHRSPTAGTSRTSPPTSWCGGGAASSSSATASAIPCSTFEGLGTLIRMCEVDFNAKIIIDVKDIRLNGTPPWSTQRWAVGRIDYGDGAATAS